MTAVAPAVPGARDDVPDAVVSVVIACRDAAATLAAQLEALAAQDVPWPWEVVVADNGSRDGSAALARSYAGRLRLTVVDAGDRPGAGAARNAGAAVATGEYLVFCDADDVVAPGWLAALRAALDEAPFVAGRFESRLLNGRRALRSRRLDQDRGLQGAVGGPAHAGAGNMGVRADAFRAVGGFDPAVRYLEDTDLSWRLRQAGVPLRWAPDAVVHVRLRHTLAGMWRQGLAYGGAHALLEARFTGPAPDVAPAAVTVVRRRRGRQALRTLLADGVPSAGRVVWPAGWHVGHRRARRAGRSRPAPETAPVPSPQG